ncbi:hypothetical protein EJ997_10340 [Flaviflexus ciconiae]|uniref:Uncharacterized protein n=1 Tax=Flaviflexus ciconiae TaxID=2496867 RepID=A0A3S9PZB0_9ACTO|nr:hypothetical protein [Flaviflexus ciconiae]AZQ77682.1 hypothetical protein EJ997_10340 [Flaviflexus ciconiae]
MTAQERLDAVTVELEAAGARVFSVAPLADPDAPHVVVAHDVRVSSPTPQVHAEATAILAAHRVPTDGLVPWVDPTIEEGETGESIDH